MGSHDDEKQQWRIPAWVKHAGLCSLLFWSKTTSNFEGNWLHLHLTWSEDGDYFCRHVSRRRHDSAKMYVFSAVTNDCSRCSHRFSPLISLLTRKKLFVPHCHFGVRTVHDPFATPRVTPVFSRTKPTCLTFWSHRQNGRGSLKFHLVLLLRTNRIRLSAPFVYCW